MSARGCVFGRYTTPTIIVLRSLIWISKNTDSITCGMNTDRSSRFTYVTLLFINNPTPPRP